MTSICKDLIVRVCNLSYDEKELFEELFYHLVGFDDRYYSCPCGCPWFFCNDTDFLIGYEIRDMVVNYYIDNKKKIREREIAVNAYIERGLNGTND